MMTLGRYAYLGMALQVASDATNEDSRMDHPYLDNLVRSQIIRGCDFQGLRERGIGRV
jgi:hypothetical protein